MVSIAVLAVILFGCGVASSIGGRFRCTAVRTSSPRLAENNPEALLHEANHLSWILNWYAAGPLYQRAEEIFTIMGDNRDVLYAKIGYMRSQAESMSFVDLSEFLGMPAAAYLTWRGTMLEGKGIVPDEEVSLSRGMLMVGRDSQLERACSVAGKL